MIATLLKLAAGLIAAGLIGLASMGLMSQAEHYQREQNRAKNERPSMGPVARPAPSHTSQLATVSTGCVADHYVMD